eukprot:6046953-Pyramimonas_sp.AAC.1
MAGHDPREGCAEMAAAAVLRRSSPIGGGNILVRGMPKWVRPLWQSDSRGFLSPPGFLRIFKDS